MIDVTVVLLEGGNGSTAVNPIEVFSAAGVLWNKCTGAEPQPVFAVTTTTPGGKPATPDGGYYTFRPSHRISDIVKTDMVIIPSIGLDIDAALEKYAGLVEWIAKQHRRGAKIAGICSGVSLLAASGILDGKRATTHWALAGDFAARWPQINWCADLLITEDQGVFCSGGVYASMDLSLYLVEKFAGRDVALGCAKSLLLNMPRPSQVGYGILPLGAAHSDPVIRRAEEWIHDHFTEDFRFEDLAADLAMSPRNFIRRFKGATGETPLNYVQKLRIATAKRLLEEEFRTVQEVAFAVGYEDQAFFRSVFRRHAGQSPHQYKSRFGKAA